jgi:hypothetical protein
VNRSKRVQTVRRCISAGHYQGAKRQASRRSAVDEIFGDDV